MTGLWLCPPSFDCISRLQRNTYAQ
jgi:hypothetical protein